MKNCMKKLGLTLAGLFLGVNAFAANPDSFEIGAGTGTALVVISTLPVTILDIEPDTGPIGAKICCYDAPETTGIVAGTCQQGSYKDVSGATLDSGKVAQVTITGGLDSMKLVAPIQRPRTTARGAVCGASATTIQGRVIWQAAQ